MSEDLEAAFKQLEQVAVISKRIGVHFGAAFQDFGNIVQALIETGSVTFIPLSRMSRTAANDLYASFFSLSEEMGALNGTVSSASSMSITILRDVYAQMNPVSTLWMPCWSCKTARNR